MSATKYFSSPGDGKMAPFEGKSDAGRVETFFSQNGIVLRVEGVEHGPVVTKYVVTLVNDTDHVSKVEGLRRDLGLRLGVGANRVFIGETRWNGGVYLAIEVPNASRVAVPPSAVIPVPNAGVDASGLLVGVGVDTSGVPFRIDLSKAPHVLVAGQSGSGKSVFLNSLVCGLLDNYGVSECLVGIIDPKGTEFAAFDGHPHLSLLEERRGVPAVCGIGKAGEAESVFTALVEEMESRMSEFGRVGVSNLREYRGVSGKTYHMPYYVLVVDEFYDLLMNYPDTEKPLSMLAAKSRSTGIHLVLATQRPSVDVIRGALKANLSTRIALKVASRTDSQVIIDQGGAESLCGNGDMLYCGPDGDVPRRLHGCLVTTEQIVEMVAATRK